MVVAPVAMAFDENGRLFVAEMRDYPGNRNASPHLGRIRLLEDPEGEGEFTASTVYAEDLPWPSALACYDGGLFVSAAPDLLYLRDSQHNGIADVRNVVFTGFGGQTPASPDLLPNNLSWGLDNQFHGASAGIGGTITRPVSSSGPVSLAWADFAFDPRTLMLQPEAGPSQSGLSFDNRGRKFSCDFDRPLIQATYSPRYAVRNPFYAKPPGLFDVVNPLSPVFRAAPAAALSKPPAPRAGSASPGRLLSSRVGSARGAVIYRGNAFPRDYYENAFIPDFAGHLVHREVLRESGLATVGERAPDEAAVEFLVSRDPLFQPVQAMNGPDGALYLADFHGGGEQGRIYRILSADFRPPKTPQLGKAPVYELVAALSHLNGWQQDTAARLLYQRRDPAAIPLLEDTLNYSRLPRARLHALWALDGLGALREADLLKSLQDQDESVRQQSIRLCEKTIKNGGPSDNLWSKLSSLADDPSLEVRYQLAFTLGEIRRPERVSLLARILAQNRDDLWVQDAVLSSLADGGVQMLSTVAKDPRFRDNPAGQEFMLRLADMVGLQNNPNAPTQALGSILGFGFARPQTSQLLNALGNGLLRARNFLADVDTQNLLLPLYGEASTESLSEGLQEGVRAEAIRFLGLSGYPPGNLGSWLLLIIGSTSPQSVQSAAISTVCRLDDPSLATNLLARWPALTPPLRSQTLAELLGRKNLVGLVVSGLENGTISPADFFSPQLNFLRTSSDAALCQRALARLGPVPVKRPEAMKQFTPALRLQGVRNAGISHSRHGAPIAMNRRRKEGGSAPL